MRFIPCHSCSGLVPSGSERCPHCSLPFTSGLARAAKTVVATLSGGAVAVTLMACYGMAPSARQPAVQPSQTPSPSGSTSDSTSDSTLKPLTAPSSTATDGTTNSPPPSIAQ